MASRRTTTASRPTSRASGELIRLWTTRHNRWLSPKFIAGESYGTIRAAALAEHLQTRHGLYVNGIMLISSVLDLATVDFEFRNDRAHVDYLPTYAATAHFHGKHGRKSLKTVLAEAEEYAARDYPWALSRGSRLSAAERAEHVARLAALTGLSEEYVDRADLRIEHVRFFTELLRDQGLAVGRLDSRFTGPLARGNAETWDADPSMDAISGPYAAAWNHYVRDELDYRNDLPYAQLSELASTEWSFKEFEGKPIDVSAAARPGDAGQPAPEGARRLRLPRRGDSLLRGAGRRGPPGDPGVAAREHRARLLRGRPHDVRARAEPAPAVQGPGLVC